MPAGVFPGMYKSIAEWYSSLVDARFWNLQNFSDGESFCRMIKTIAPDFDIPPERPLKGYLFENEPETEVEKKFRFVGDFIESQYNVKLELSFLRECYDAKHETSIAMVAVFLLTALTNFYNSKQNEAMTKLLMLETEVQNYIKECMEFILNTKGPINIALLHRILTRHPQVIVPTPSKSKRKSHKQASSRVPASPFSSLKGLINSLPRASVEAQKSCEASDKAFLPSVKKKETIVQKINEVQEVESSGDCIENHTLEVKNLNLNLENGVMAEEPDEKFADLESELIHRRNQADRLRKENADLQKAVAAEFAKTENLAKKFADMELELDHEKKQAIVMRKENGNIRNGLYEAEETNSDLRNEIDALKKEMGEKEKKFEDLKKRTESWAKESTSDLMVSHGFEQVLEAKNREHQISQHTVDMLTEENSHLSQKCTENSEQIKADGEKIQSLKAENDRCSRRLSECEAEIKSLQMQLEEANAQVRAFEKAKEQREKDIMDEMANYYKSPAKSPRQPEVIHFHEQDHNVTKYYEQIAQLNEDLQENAEKVCQLKEELRGKDEVIKNQVKELEEKEVHIKNQLEEIEGLRLFKPLSELQCHNCKCVLIPLNDEAAEPSDDRPIEDSVGVLTRKRKRARIVTPLTSTPQETSTSRDVPQTAKNPYKTMPFDDAKKECLEFIYNVATGFGTVEEIHPQLKREIVSLMRCTDKTDVSLMVALGIVSCITDDELKEILREQKFMTDYSLRCLLRSVLQEGVRNYQRLKDISDVSSQNLQRLQEKEKEAEFKKAKYEELYDVVQRESRVIVNQSNQYRRVLEETRKDKKYWFEKYNQAIKENPPSVPEKCKDCEFYEKQITSWKEHWSEQYMQMGGEKVKLAEELQATEDKIYNLKADIVELKEEISTVKRVLGPQYPVIEKKQPQLLYTVRSVVARNRNTEFLDTEGSSKDDLESRRRLAEAHMRDEERRQLCFKGFQNGFELEDEESINTNNDICANPQYANNRLTEIQMRNFTTAPHLKSLYPTELDHMTPTQKKYLERPEFQTLVEPEHSAHNYLITPK